MLSSPHSRWRGRSSSVAASLISLLSWLSSVFGPFTLVGRIFWFLVPVVRLKDDPYLIK